MPKDVKMIRVVAIGRGFDGTALREVGEEFSMPESIMTAKVEKDGKVIAPTWFRPVGAKKLVEADELA